MNKFFRFCGQFKNIHYLKSTKFKKKNSHTSRFTTILDELKNNSNQQSGIYLTVLVGFINCLISQPALLRKRLQMRFEFQSNLIKAYQNSSEKSQVSKFSSKLTKQKRDSSDKILI